MSKPRHSSDIPTKTAATEIRYQDVGWRCLRAYADEVGISPTQVCPIDLVAWIIQSQPNWKPATWRQYKAAVIFILETFYPCHTEAINLLASTPQSNCRRVGRSTSDKKIKAMPADDLFTILLHLRTSRSQYRLPLSHFLMASTLTGVRPAEWRLAQLLQVKGRPLLLVVNAKHTNGRGLRRVRRLWLDHLPAEYVDIIRGWLSDIRDVRGMRSYKKFTANLSEVLRRTNLTLWPTSERHYTLYSCRHQAAANFKTSYSPAEVAALLGHATDTTAVTHYARRSAGSRTLIASREVALPAPAEEAVALVRPGKVFRPTTNSVGQPDVECGGPTFSP
ncbi:site-specific integrase [Magnetospirillum sp. ME-1]|uniref:site-specific integrase n=1 Tax=Magnetospirillum sp. ME-1 TaxID=1639348 RepID=UPI0011AE90E0|nr:site-specific integrase [Magnetospirillum sp. ME-1]